MPEPYNPYAPPGATLDSPAPVAERRPELASLALRFWAAVLDWLLLSASGMIGAVCIQRSNGQLGAWSLGRRIAFVVTVVYAVYFAIHVACVVRFRASPGKVLLGARVVLVSGREASIARLLLVRPLVFVAAIVAILIGQGLEGISAFSTIVIMLALAALLSDTLRILVRDRRCWHDMIAGTIVVKRQRA